MNQYYLLVRVKVMIPLFNWCLNSHVEEMGDMMYNNYILVMLAYIHPMIG